MDLIAYKCLTCGEFTISRYDGRRCLKCNGYLAPQGKANIANRENRMRVQVRLRDTDLFNDMIAILKEVLDDKDISIDVKGKIKRLLRE